MKEIIKMRTEINWKERNNKENQRNLKLVLGKKLLKQMNIQQNWKNMTQISKMRNERCTITQTLLTSKVYHGKWTNSFKNKRTQPQLFKNEMKTQNSLMCRNELNLSHKIPCESLPTYFPGGLYRLVSLVLGIMYTHTPP